MHDRFTNVHFSDCIVGPIFISGTEREDRSKLAATCSFRACREGNSEMEDVMTIERRKNHSQTAAPRRLPISLRSSAAIISLAMLFVAPAFVAPASATSGVPPYQYTEMQEAPPRHDDCVAVRVGPASAPPFEVYQSHVEWRDDEVAAPATRGPGPEWQILSSHVDRNDECSLHPLVMGWHRPSYSWDDVVRFISGS
jgi:hypothetical protein